MVVGNESGIAYPDADALVATLEDLPTTKNRLDDVERLLNAC